MLIDQQTEALLLPPYLEKLTLVVKEMNPHKSSGPNGFTVYFYQHFWEVLKHGILSMVQNFFNCEHLPKEINNTNIVFIPKNNKAVDTSSYRPIILCNVLYKIISKWMVLRLQPIIQ
uniref:Reverse transcriptase n=1 Tax=Nelumbo nucifera TaxID=4432 RepID=A0A822XMZ5_NELNU|nr:TPA_asm: hypothetical protein HUJ06_021588 [Nelumbo nucifera]